MPQAALDPLAVQVSNDAEEPLDKIGDVLLLIWRWTRAVLAAGARDVAPNPNGSPRAGTKGDQGNFEVSRNGARQTVRWYADPAAAEQYFLAAVRASTKLKPDELVEAHRLLQEKVSDEVAQDFNWASATHRTLQHSSFVSVLAEHRTTGAGATALVKEVAELRAELRKRTATPIKEEASPHQKAKPTNVCHMFQQGVCKKTAEKCSYLHPCARCGSTAHGAYDCDA